MGNEIEIVDDQVPSLFANNSTGYEIDIDLKKDHRFLKKSMQSVASEAQ